MENPPKSSGIEEEFLNLEGKIIIAISSAGEWEETFSGFNRSVFAPYLWAVTRVSINRSPLNFGANASSALLEFEFWEKAMSSFIDSAAGDDAVTRISLSLGALNAADADAAAAQRSATGCLIL